MHTPDYDAFGEPAVGRARVSASRLARTVAVTVFWSVAALLIAGRVYQQEVGAPGYRMEIAAR